MYIPETWYLGINIFIAVILLFCLIKGLIDGFVYEVINLVFLLLSILASWFAAPILATKVTIVDVTPDNMPFIDFTGVNTLANTVIWFLILFIILNLLFIILKPLIKKISKLPVIGAINRILGGILGLIYGFLIVLGICLILNTPAIKNGKEVKENTILQYTDVVSQEVTKFIVNNIDIKGYQDDIAEFDIDKARQDFSDWLQEIGVLDA